MPRGDRQNQVSRSRAGLTPISVKEQLVFILSFKIIIFLSMIFGKAFLKVRKIFENKKLKLDLNFDVK